MNELFALINTDETGVSYIAKYNIRRGSIVNGKKLGKLDPDTVYQEAGLYPIIDTPPALSAHERISGSEYQIDDTNKVVNRVYTIVSDTLDEVKTKKLQEVKDKFLKDSERPVVTVTLSDGTTFDVDGGRHDKDNLKELYESMVRNAITSTEVVGTIEKRILSDVDVNTCYITIVENAQALYQAKWAKEAEINNVIVDGTVNVTEADAIAVVDSIII